MEKVPQVLVIGDACTDVTIAVDTTRKNPEFPDVPLLRQSNTKPNSTKGMAWLVARSLSNLGFRVSVETPPASNEIKTRYIDIHTGLQVCRIDSESPFKQQTGKLNKATRDHILSCIAANSYAAVVISDYCKGFLSEEDIHTIVHQCNRYNTSVFIDTKKKDLTCCKGAVIKINQHEYTSLSDIPTLDTEMIVTLGEQGAMHPTVGLMPGYIPEFRDNDFPLDPCGAGDFFLAGLVYGYIKGCSVAEAMQYAIVNAGMRVHGMNYIQCSASRLEEEKKKYYDKITR